MAESSITVKVDVDSEALRESIRDLLNQYSTWLDTEGLVVPGDESDTRTHDDLVTEFLGGR